MSDNTTENKDVVEEEKPTIEAGEEANPSIEAGEEAKPSIEAGDEANPTIEAEPVETKSSTVTTLDKVDENRLLEIVNAKKNELTNNKDLSIKDSDLSIVFIKPKKDGTNNVDYIVEKYKFNNDDAKIEIDSEFKEDAIPYVSKITGGKRINRTSSKFRNKHNNKSKKYYKDTKILAVKSNKKTSRKKNELKRQRKTNKK